MCTLHLHLLFYTSPPSPSPFYSHNQLHIVGISVTTTPPLHPLHTTLTSAPPHHYLPIKHSLRHLYLHTTHYTPSLLTFLSMYGIIFYPPSLPPPPSLTQSLTHSLPPSPTLTHSITHSLTPSLPHPHSLNHSLTPSLPHPHSLPPSLPPSLPSSLPPFLPPSPTPTHSITH